MGTNLLAAGYLYSQILACEIKYSDDNSPEVLAMNADEINQQVNDVYRNGGPKELLSISCVGIGDDVPTKNIIEFLKACERL